MWYLVTWCLLSTMFNKIVNTVNSKEYNKMLYDNDVEYWDPSKLMMNDSSCDGELIDCIHLVKRMLIVDDSKRGSPKELLKDKFLINGQKVAFSKCSNKEEKDRVIFYVRQSITMSGFVLLEGNENERSSKEANQIYINKLYLQIN